MFKMNNRQKPFSMNEDTIITSFQRFQHLYQTPLKPLAQTSATTDNLNISSTTQTIQLTVNNFSNQPAVVFNHEIDLFDKEFSDSITNEYLPLLSKATKQSEHLVRYDDVFYQDRSSEARTFLCVNETSSRLIDSLTDGSLLTLEQLIYAKSQHGEGTFTQQEIIQTFRSIIKALNALHSQNVTHKNITPKNILVIDDLVMLSNYGIGYEKIIDLLTENERYLAPEVLDESRFSIKSDLYAAGIVMLKMLTLKDVNVEFDPDFEADLLTEILNSFSADEASDFGTLVTFVLACVREDENERPDIDTLLDLLPAEPPVMIEEEKEKTLKKRRSFSLLQPESSPMQMMPSFSDIYPQSSIPPSVASNALSAMSPPPPSMASVHAVNSAKPQFDNDEEYEEAESADQEDELYTLSEDVMADIPSPPTEWQSAKKKKLRARRERTSQLTAESQIASRTKFPFALRRSATPPSPVPPVQSALSTKKHDTISAMDMSVSKERSMEELDNQSLQLASSRSFKSSKTSRGIFSFIKDLALPWFGSRTKEKAIEFSDLDQIVEATGPPVLCDDLGHVLKPQQQQQKQQIEKEEEEVKIQNVPQNRKKLYKILERIGVGTQGNCLLAEKDGIQYAMKRYKDGHDDEYQAELTILQTLQHQYLVSMIEYFTDVDEGSEGELSRYIILEYCKKGDLGKFLMRNYKRKPMPQEKFIKLATEILQGIEFMHSMGYGHFDLKPANVFVAEDSSIKLGDFGFSQKFGLTVHGGSQEYIAPEQIQGNNVGTAAIDVFAFGTICLEILTRKKRDLKLEMKQDDWLDVLWAKECAEYSADLLPVLKSLLHVDPSQRPSASQALQTIRQISC